MIRSAVDLIRRHRPRTIAVPYWDDRHPDHVAASQVLRLAAFKSGLRRYRDGGERVGADWICYYFINDAAAPSFVVDVSAHYDRKRAALDCHRSQFTPPGRARSATRLSAPTFRQLIESRDAQFGALAGVAFAEGIVVREPIQRPGLLKHVHEHRHGVLRLGRRQRRRRHRAGYALAIRGHRIHVHQQRAAVPAGARGARAVLPRGRGRRRTRSFASRSTCSR
jgi:hypothetical protein